MAKRILLGALAALLFTLCGSPALADSSALGRLSIGTGLNSIGGALNITNPAPSSSTAGDVATFSNGTGGWGDSGTLLASLAPLSNPNFSGYLQISGTACDIATGSFSVGGSLSAIPTLSAAGQGCIFLRSTLGGVQIIGWGSTYDLELYDSGGGLACEVNHNALPFYCNNLVAIGTFGLGSSNVMLISHTAPTIASGFGTSPSISNSNGTAAFIVTVGTSNAGTGTLTMPAASHGWSCTATDLTTVSSTVFSSRQHGSLSTTAVTLNNYDDTGASHAWVDGDLLSVQCDAL